MKKTPADNTKDNRFELLRELLLAEDREKFGKILNFLLRTSWKNIRSRS